MGILAGDIGGTKALLGLFSTEGGGLEQTQLRSYRCSDYENLNGLLTDFLKKTDRPITQSCLSIAGPLQNQTSHMTNLGWDIDGAELEKQGRLGKVRLLNDLEALALGTLSLKKQDSVVISQYGQKTKHGIRAIIAAGTGLGEGFLCWKGGTAFALPSEGGHVDFGPRNETELALLRFLFERYPHVSYERILSGSGFYLLFAFLKKHEKHEIPPWLLQRLQNEDPAVVISDAALSGTSELCNNTLDLFCDIYGAAAGNLALKILPSGGVFVGGGIAPKIIEKLKSGAFMRAFLDKGRYRGLLENISVEVILNPETALWGAAACASRGFPPDKSKQG